MTSLKKQFSIWMFGILVVVGVLAAGISYFLARDDATALLDEELRLVAESIDEGSQLASMQQTFSRESRAQARRDFVLQVWYEDKPVRSSRPAFQLARGTVSGFSSMPGEHGLWRVYTLVYPDRTVQVSQSYAVRSEIATDSALRTLIPILALIPLLWLLSTVGVRRILKPLEAVTQAATTRDATSLAPLPVAAIPEEVTPLVMEMNALLERLERAIKSQQQFVSDAAHELRTPLAAMRLQIENLMHSCTGNETQKLGDELMAGVKRATHMVNQLLKMARFEVKRQSAPHALDLTDLVASCIGNLIPVAEAKGIDLGMDHAEAARVLSDADDLAIVFNNLIDNAIRYTPQGGRIDVSLIRSGDYAVVEIVDDGPGIPDALLGRVFDRFFRASSPETEGSGIGLAIVKAILERESAAIALYNRRDGNSGLVARVSLPMMPVAEVPTPAALRQPMEAAEAEC